jgi:hypothetical protein
MPVSYSFTMGRIQSTWPNTSYSRNLTSSKRIFKRLKQNITWKTWRTLLKLNGSISSRRIILNCLTPSWITFILEVTSSPFPKNAKPIWRNIWVDHFILRIYTSLHSCFSLNICIHLSHRDKVSVARQYIRWENYISFQFYLLPTIEMLSWHKKLTGCDKF